MQKDIIEYSDLSFEEFLLDDFFVRSNLYPTEESILFWQRFEQEIKRNLENYFMAKNCLHYLDKDLLVENSVANIWDHIKTANKLLKNREILLEHNEDSDKDGKKLNVQPVKTYRKKVTKGVIRLTYRWAAAIALFIFVGGALFYQWVQSMQPIEEAVSAYQEINVPLGSRSSLILPDGSHITLNAGTKLRYDVNFGKEHRGLWLDGEGYFDVKKSDIPFIVHTGTVQIKAVGTSFNVRAYLSENNIETTLVEGKIIVTDEKQVETKEVILLPNQKLTIIKDAEKVKPIAIPEESLSIDYKTNTKLSESMIFQENVDPIPDISWKSNALVIDRESIEDLAVKLERWFDIKIIFKDEQVKTYRYNGSLPNLSLEQVLNAMSLVTPISYSVQGKTVIFSENKKYKNK